MEVPKEIFDEIFIKLSTRDAFRMSIVSRQSYHIINGKYFQSLHSMYNSSIPSPSTPLFITDRRDSDNFIISIRLGHPHPNPKLYNISISSKVLNGYWTKNPWYDNDYTIGNACNGLLCIVSTDEQRKQPTVIRNPIHQEYVIVPSSSESGYVSRSTGLGYYVKTRKHKLVSIFDGRLMVYTLGVDCSWRQVGVIRDYAPFLGPVCIGGGLYWVVLDVRTVAWKKCLMLLDVEKEEVSVIMSIPSALDDCHFTGIRLKEIRGEVALVGFYEDYVEIWMINEGFCWLRRHMIRFPRVCLEVKEKYSRIEEIWEKDDDVLALLIDDVMISYNYKEKEKGDALVEEFPIIKVIRRIGSCFVVINQALFHWRRLLLKGSLLNFDWILPFFIEELYCMSFIRDK